MRISGSDVRAGMVVEHKNRLWVVVKHALVTPGNLRGFNQVELKDVMNGSKYNERFSSSEQVERVTLEEKAYQYLYPEGDSLTFMDNDSYEQFTVNKDMVGPQIVFLQEGMNVTMRSYEGKIIHVKLPDKVEATVAEADPVVKGQTASSSYKPAILENGVKITVPPHIASGTRIIVDTNEFTYVGRAQ